jgi:hypothetical protein
MLQIFPIHGACKLAATDRIFSRGGLRIAALLACILVCTGKTQASAQSEITLPAKTTGEAMRLSGAARDTHFDATGVVFESGKSKRYQSPPKFALLSDPLRDADADRGYHDTKQLEAWELPNGEIYPIQLRDLHSPSISGFTVIGQQSRDLPWRVIKAMWDGDALHVKGCSGIVRVSDVYWENVEDGFGPIDELEAWSLHGAYMRYIRDDAVENDDLHPGEIVDCLVDGCFVFLSQRSSSGSGKTSEGVTTIRDCVVHVQSQPHDGVDRRVSRDKNIRIGDDGIGRAPGMIFKWDSRMGRVDVKDCTFRMDAMSFNGAADMIFPPGEYENVTLVWLAGIPYPQPLPSGITLSTDIADWRNARQAWIDRMPANHPAAAVLQSTK